MWSAQLGGPTIWDKAWPRTDVWSVEEGRRREEGKKGEEKGKNEGREEEEREGRREEVGASH